MLIACIGPDVYRALEKARELEGAFRKKYDAEGVSVEQLPQDGTELIDALIERVNTVSLFTPLRFLRVRDLLKNCPKGRIGALEKALAVDPDHVIVVTVESDLPPDATVKRMEVLPKWVRYDFPRLQGRAFESWIRECLMAFGDTPHDTEIQEIITQSEGDSWQASLQILQVVAGRDGSEEVKPVKASTTQLNRSVFDWADAYLKQDPEWRHAVELLGPDAVLYPFLSQLRSYERVKNGQEQGVPAFVSRKLKGMRGEDVEERFLRLLEATLLQRQGYLREEELSVLF